MPSPAAQLAKENLLKLDSIRALGYWGIEVHSGIRISGTEANPTKPETRVFNDSVCQLLERAGRVPQNNIGALLD